MRGTVTSARATLPWVSDDTTDTEPSRASSSMRFAMRVV